MTIDKEYIDEFKALYKKEYDEELSDEKAHAMFVNLVLLYQQLNKPVPPDYISPSKVA